MRIEKIKMWAAVLLSFATVFLPLSLKGQSVGEPAPDFELTLLSGSTFKLSDQQGKVIFIFLFGNSCPSCKAAAPFIESQIYDEFKDDEGFIAVGLDTWNSSSSVASVTAFKNSTGVSFPLAIKAGSVATDYGSTYDRLMVIDRDGVLVHKGSVGAKNDIGNVVNVIREALAAMQLDPANEQDARLKVYPVPAKDVLYFQSDERISRIRLYDMQGRQLDEHHFEGLSPGEARAVSLSGLSSGVYFYMIDGPDSGLTGRFTVH